MTWTNKIHCGDSLEVLKTMPDKLVDMCMTSPPYWALRDYGTAKWEGGNPDCDHKAQNNIKGYEGDWERPSRKEFNKIGTLLKCQVCGKNFNGKIGNKFCSTKCLNTLSNEERTKAKSEMVNTCSKCGAVRVDNQLGLEPTFDEYINKLCNIFDEVKRVLKDTGTVWVNLGDTYGGSGNSTGHTDKTKNLGYTTSKMGASKGNQDATRGLEKSLVMIPFRFAIEMVNRGWILRNTIIWYKSNCMPSSVKDRFTVDFEYIFLFSKQKKYYFEQQFEEVKEESIKRAEYGWDCDRPSTQSNNGVHTEKMGERFVNEQGRNKRCVWNINPKPYSEAHFAVYPEELCITPIKAGCPEYVCKNCGKVRKRIEKVIGKTVTDSMKVSGCNSEGEYKGKEVKEYEGTGAQKPSETKRRILESMSQVKEYSYSDCGCNAGFEGGIVLDPFSGAGTTSLVARKLNRQYIGIELNESYVNLSERRIHNEAGLL